jgi:hypothetical protein
VEEEEQEEEVWTEILTRISVQISTMHLKRVITYEIMRRECVFRK